MAENAIDASTIISKMTALRNLGHPYTDEEIDEYEIDTIKSTGNLSFVTTEKINVNLVAQDELSDIDTEKRTDRVTFTYEYNDKKLQRSFILETNAYVFARENSGYPGHLVLWNPEISDGNWIDFVEKSGLDLRITAEKLESKNKEILLSNTDRSLNNKGLDKYLIVVESIVPPNPDLIPRRKCLLFCDWMTEEELIEYYYGIGSLNFESIGGTNVYNASYLFYTGAQVNLSTYNIYDGGSYIDDWTVDITTINSYPGFNGSFIVNTSTEIVENLTNGSYTFSFTHPWYIPKTYNVEINNVSQALVYNTSQSILNVIARNVKSLDYVTNTNAPIWNW